MFKHKHFISGENVDAVYINDNYQDALQPLNLNPEKIQSFQFVVDIVTTEKQEIKIAFYSLQDMIDFSKAYKLK